MHGTLIVWLVCVLLLTSPNRAGDAPATQPLAGVAPVTARPPEVQIVEWAPRSGTAYTTASFRFASGAFPSRAAPPDRMHDEPDAAFRPSRQFTGGWILKVGCRVGNPRHGRAARWQHTASTEKCTAFNAALMQAAARKRGQTIGHYLIAHAGRTTWGWLADGFA